MVIMACVALNTSLSRHLATLFRAGKTCLRAFLTMTGVMLAALFTARLANIGAQSADVRGKLAAARHGGGREPADRRAVHIRTNTVGHHGRIGFCQACSRTMITHFGATVAGCNAVGILLMSHGHILAKNGLEWRSKPPRRSQQVPCRL